MNTPWGRSDSQTTIIRTGITSVDTPSHGGLMVRMQWALKNLSEAARALGIPFQNREGNWLCYEEDCAYAIVLWELTDQQRWLYCRLLLVPDPKRTETLYKDSLRRSLSTNFPHYLNSIGAELDYTGYERYLKWQEKEKGN